MASSYFYTILCIISISLFIEEYLVGSELVGPFSLVIGFLVEFFRQEMGR